MKSNTQRRPSPLKILTTFLIGSAILRVASFDLSAVAQQTPVEPDTDPVILDIPFSVEGLENILEALKAREAELDAIDMELENRGRILARTKADVEQKIAELEEAERRLAATLALADTAAEEDITRLAAVYENMKPKDAAEVFAVMTPNFAAGFLSRMQPEAAAAVMTELDPTVGHTISVIFAGRNANAFQE